VFLRDRGWPVSSQINTCSTTWCCWASTKNSSMKLSLRNAAALPRPPLLCSGLRIVASRTRSKTFYPASTSRTKMPSWSISSSSSSHLRSPSNASADRARISSSRLATCCRRCKQPSCPTMGSSRPKKRKRKSSGSSS